MNVLIKVQQGVVRAQKAWSASAFRATSTSEVEGALVRYNEH